MIGTLSKTRELIEKHHVVFKKSYGQNFLIDNNITTKIVASAELSKTDDVVIEIGPGIGTLTELLAEQAFKVIAIEIDKRLIPVLNDTLKQFDNVTIINEDILKVDLLALINEECVGKNVKIVANLPYYITTPIIMNVLETRLPIKSMTVMVQKEVGARMKSGVGTKDYGALSIAVAYYADCNLVVNVPNTCFVPKPNVDSIVIKLDMLETPKVNVNNPDLLFLFVKAGFFQRRKTLINCLTNYPLIEIDKDDATALVKACGLNENIRGEALTLEDYAQLTNEYEKQLQQKNSSAN